MAAIEFRDRVPRTSVFNDPKVRGMIWQAVLVAAVASLVYMAVTNAIENLRSANIASGFEFLGRTAGFDINQTLISYEATSTYGRAFVVGLLNTLLVGAIGVVLATIIGFSVGIARLSSNWIVARVAAGYVEIVRNVPLLLQLYIWYNAVLKPLPSPRRSLDIFGVAFLNNRGLVIPRPLYEAGFAWVWLTLAVSVVAAVFWRIRAKRQQDATGEQSHLLLVPLAIVAGPTLVAYLLTGMPLGFDVPRLDGFNFEGGIAVYPEFVALLLGLSIYTGAFIAEIVRAGILSVNRGQTEAANALGLRAGPTLKLVVVPQAMRVIIPPLTSQYLNLVKNSSLAVAIGYPDLVQVFTGTVLNQTGQAIEVVAMTMAVYLTFSLFTSAFMNWYNRRVALVER